MQGLTQIFMSSCPQDHQLRGWPDPPPPHSAPKGLISPLVDKENENIPHILLLF